MSSFLGENIKKYRLNLGLSIKELSEKSGVGSSTISQIETGKRKSLRSESLEKIARALNLNVNDLLSIDEGSYEVSDLNEAIQFILSDDEVSIDDIPLSSIEKEQFRFAVQMAIDTIRNNRRK
jgi:HTH-type transcriptional regulator, competence development regulator